MLLSGVEGLNQRARVLIAIQITTPGPELKLAEQFWGTGALRMGPLILPVVRMGLEIGEN